jgi:hypothetical protein
VKHLLRPDQIDTLNKAKSAKVESSNRVFGFFEQTRDMDQQDDQEISSPLFPCSGMTSRLDDASKSKECLSPIHFLEKSKKDEITEVDEFQEL